MTRRVVVQHMMFYTKSLEFNDYIFYCTNKKNKLEGGSTLKGSNSKYFSNNLKDMFRLSQM